MHKEFLIEASDNSASGVKVWILTAMVVLLMAIVSFLTVRLINTVDETEAAVQASKEVQASQGEVIKGLQRDRDNTDKEIERLRNQVDRLKDDNAALKAKVGIPLTLNSEPPSGGFFVSAIRSGLLSESVPHNTQKLIRESPEPDWRAQQVRAFGVMVIA
ncbi:conjugal transfer protein TraF [Raoultella ornithinolytica]|jgi:cell division protein FtsB|uniref:conjugal transfer protein TraF n=1 Tax=Klebsiella/Raoultella group TaxID=2890311 RepID=UPI0005370FE8|nr:MULTISPECIES: conjugal transfer protein TraF [Klebsiella/Raoultella group]ELT9685889.1 conjugal transfer protein TraF [Klebsiella oxytoca]ELT9979556.1 conjugal transfer protein TraF [Klebsiella oxytoca]MBZ7186858.1 conjugal transfer protein TraF [Klebsiella michiganensis]MDX7499956.1 conjugal transfer protein TraF [Raoultella ornithinolytica]PNO43948.1 hypothetical protein MC52_015955 [Klebsiella michiganensis]